MEISTEEKDRALIALRKLDEATSNDANAEPSPSHSIIQEAPGNIIALECELVETKKDGKEAAMHDIIIISEDAEVEKGETEGESKYGKLEGAESNATPEDGKMQEEHGEEDLKDSTWTKETPKRKSRWLRKKRKKAEAAMASAAAALGAASNSTTVNTASLAAEPTPTGSVVEEMALTIVSSEGKFAEIVDDGKEETAPADFISENEKLDKGAPVEEVKDGKIAAAEISMTVPGRELVETENDGMKSAMKDIVYEDEPVEKGDTKDKSKNGKLEGADCIANAEDGKIGEKLGEEGIMVLTKETPKKESRGVRKRRRKAESAALLLATAAAATPTAATAATPTAVTAATPTAATAATPTAAAVSTLAAEPTPTESVLEKVELHIAASKGKSLEIGDDGKEETAPVEVEMVSIKKARRMRKRQRMSEAAAAATATAITSNNADRPGTSAAEKRLKKDAEGLIFMCSAKTKRDCFRYRVLGLPESKKDVVTKVYKGMRLFLFDVDLKLMYGIYKAASPGGYNIEPKAFKSKFPSQVRFSVLKDCLPLSEEKFKPAIRANYYGKGKFNTRLSAEQVKNLCSLFEKADKSSNRKNRRARPSRAELGSSFYDDDRQRRNPTVRMSDYVYSRRQAFHAREAYASPDPPPTALPTQPPALSFNDDRDRLNPMVRGDDYVYSRGQTFHTREAYASPHPPPAALPFQPLAPSYDDEDRERRNPLVRESDYVYSRGQMYHPREAYPPPAALPSQALALQLPPLTRYVYSRPADDYYIRRDPRDLAIELRGHRAIDFETRSREAVTYHDTYSYYREPGTYRDPAVYHASGLPSAYLPPSGYRS